MKSWTTGLELVQYGYWPATINHQTIFHVDLFQSLPAAINHQTIFHVDLFQSLPATINHQTIFRVDLFLSFQDLKQLAPGLSPQAFIGMLDEGTKSFGRNLSWTTNSASLARKANQRLYFLRKLRRAGAPTPIMNTFYSGAIESILTTCLTVWYGACTASCRRTLQRIVSAAEKIVGTSLPSLQDLYSSRLTRKALRLAGDPTHPLHSFFSLLPSGRRLRSLRARTTRLKDSFIHQAVRMLNSLPALPPLPLLTPAHTHTAS
ncbi:uncharacterized protein LOC143517742 [Brachyhypopomus gauderio]|uniref:uncharacterized protein LOC143517742 n=1 Tax=Brachyhypopomus gauderio TaxID=698409 RepID=UPI0040423512